MKKLYSDLYHSPIGKIMFVADGAQLCCLDFNDNEARIEKLLNRRYGKFDLASKANILNMQTRMDEYFKGNWEAFDGLDIGIDGTDFQQRVWGSLKKIPVGKTITYHQLAGSIKKPKAVRAVASANARNPVAIIIPCHRVIGKDGLLRGYAGGMDRKAWLLNHEGFTI